MVLALSSAANLKPRTEPLQRIWSVARPWSRPRPWPSAQSRRSLTPLPTCMASVIASGLFPGAVRFGPCFTGSLGSAATAGRELAEGRDAWLVRCLFLPELGGRFRGGTRAARGLPGLPRSAGASACPGHDDRLGVLPPAGDAAAQSMKAVRGALARRARWRLAADWQEPAAVVPHLVSSAAVRRPDRRVTMATWETGRRAQAAVSASPPSAARMWQAWRRILRASEIAARLPSLRSFTAA